MTSRPSRIRLTLILLTAGLAAPLAVQAATATLEPTSGSKAKGQVTFLQDGSRVRATGEITGLKPGRHGLQVQEKADCSAADTDGHVGQNGTDFGNITASASGAATVSTTTTGVSIAGLMGKGLVLRAKPDDEKSDAGARVACGVVK